MEINNPAKCFRTVSAAIFGIKRDPIRDPSACRCDIRYHIYSTYVSTYCTDIVRPRYFLDRSSRDSRDRFIFFPPLRQGQKIVKRWNWHRGRLEAGRLTTNTVRLSSARRAPVFPPPASACLCLPSQYSTYSSYCLVL